MKKLFTFLVVLILSVSIFNLNIVQAEAELNNTYEGSNLGSQDYSVRSQVVYSDLTVTKENQLMRVQGDISDDQYLVQYFDSNFHIVNELTVAQELSIYGGFYSDGSYYYILSGQQNLNEDDSVEVYRITKYDQDWNRISSCGLYGANTYCPFEAGSARMVNDGNLLFIRTCHTMYASSDGLHHQANVTIEVNTDDMTVVDSYYKIMNSSYGYVSHSFNQFIRLDDGYIVGVDHGDAYPRSVALLKYNYPYSSSGFSKNSTCKDMLSISGTTGANATGVSVGGFEISDTKYLVVGNTVEMGDDYDPYGTRNIFISTLDRNLSSDVQVKYITGYEDGDTSPSTPQLVKMAENRFILLWEKNYVVNYCEINGEGEKTSAIYTMDGRLSDCQPVIYNDHVVWYTWSDETIWFNTIAVNDLSDSSITETYNGHIFGYAEAPSDSNVVSEKCLYCSLTKQETTLDRFTYRIHELNDYTDHSDCLDEGQTYYIDLYSYTPSDAALKDIVITSDSEDIISVNDNQLLANKAGTATITVYAKYRPSVKYTATITVQHDWDEGVVTKKASPAAAGSITKNCLQCGAVNYGSIASPSIVSLSSDSCDYTGSAVTPSVTVYDSNDEIVDEENYSVSYENNIDMGTATVTVTFTGDKYTGVMTKAFTIGSSLFNADITGVEDKTYTGSSITQNGYKLTSDGVELKENRDYTVSYSNNTNVGTADIIFTGIGNYTGTCVKKFSILRAGIDNAVITLSKTSGTKAEMGGASNINALVVVTYDGTTLTLDKDYYISGSYATYTCVTNDDDGEVWFPLKYGCTVAGKGNFSGTKAFSLTQYKLGYNAEVTIPETSYVYTGSKICPEVTVTADDGTVLKEGVNYKVSYSNNTKTGSATITVTGLKNCFGEVQEYFTITAPKYSVTATPFKGTYDGKSHTFTLTGVPANSTIRYQILGNGSWTKTKPTRTSVGSKTVFYKITCNGNIIMGSSTITIIPKGTSLKSLTASTKAFTVKWTKQSTQTSGYQIQYSASSGFTSAKKVTVSGTGTTSKKISGLSKKKKYYVRIRTYKTVSGTKYYSKWSAAKTVVTK